VRELSWERLPALLDPAGEPARLIENYAPVHLLLHALEWRLFGERLRPYHVVNVALHVLVSALLVAPLDPDPWVRLRSAFELVARYLAMAATSYGVSAFQEPEPAVSLLGPWWLAGVAAVAALGVRALLALRGGREEAA
jgi:hypothetical protein